MDAPVDYNVIRSSAVMWYARLAAYAPTPRTHTVPIYASRFEELVEMVAEAAEKIGYPVFIRTDQSSCKAGYSHPPNIVHKRSDILKALAHLLDCHEPVDALTFFGPPRPRFILVREYVEPVQWTQLPIPWFNRNVEVRVVVDNGEPVDAWLYNHWEAVSEYCEDVDCEALRRDYSRYLETIMENGERLAVATRLAAQAFPEGRWTVDLMLAERGWLAIDAHVYSVSWRPSRRTEEDEMVAQLVTGGSRA